MSYDFNIEYLHDMHCELSSILYDLYEDDSDTAYDIRMKVQKLDNLIVQAFNLANELEEEGIFE